MRLSSGAHALNAAGDQTQVIVTVMHNNTSHSLLGVFPSLTGSFHTTDLPPLTG